MTSPHEGVKKAQQTQIFSPVPLHALPPPTFLPLLFEGTSRDALHAVARRPSFPSSGACDSVSRPFCRGGGDTRRRSVVQHSVAGDHLKEGEGGG